MIHGLACAGGQRVKITVVLMGGFGVQRAMA
jgi:hypothetical protein